MAINWSPSPSEAVAQCVRYLVATGPGTVPLARAMGVPQDVVDSPMNVARARLTRDVVRALRTYEPRVEVTRVDVSGDENGLLEATVAYKGVG